MINEIREDNDFFEEYLTSLCARLTAKSLEISYEKPMPYTKHGVKFHNNLKAMNYLLELPTEKEAISNREIIETAALVNGPESFLSEGFRKTYVEVNNADWYPVEANQIYSRMYSLLDCYHNIWSELEDVFEREAMFHINFIKIHPFEDGNGRTGRLLLTNNLLKNNMAPVVITKEEKEEYFSYITNDDYQGFAQFLRQRSLEEKAIIDQLYQENKQTKKR